MQIDDIKGKSALKQSPIHRSLLRYTYRSNASHLFHFKVKKLRKAKTGEVKERSSKKLIQQFRLKTTGKNRVIRTPINSTFNQKNKFDLKFHLLH